jgi:uncharacterized protein YcbX
VTGHVTRISIAPVKSLRVVHPREVMLEADGVTGDRRFWLVDESGRLYNGKRDARLVTITPEWDEESRRLTLEFPDGRTVDGTVELGDAVTREMHGGEVPSRHVLGPWEAALSAFVGERLTLLWAEVPAVDRRSRDGDVTLVSSASLERLRAEAGSDDAVDGRRFRMLFEIEGVQAHAEDAWVGERVRIGEALVAFTGDVGRCVVTTRHPETGVVDLDTLGVLAAYRRNGAGEPLPFGVYGTVVETGRVRVGDVVAPQASRQPSPARR